MRRSSRTADEIRRRYVGEEIHLRAIIEFSNICTKLPLPVVESRNNNIERYRMPLESIIERAELISKLGIKTVVLQSGEDPYYTTERVTQLITEIRKFNLAITLSIGERKFEEYKI